MGRREGREKWAGVGRREKNRERKERQRRRKKMGRGERLHYQMGGEKRRWILSSINFSQSQHP